MANLRDFYIREETDPAYRPEQFEVYDEMESMLQQMRMTLFTRKGEVLGEPDFGLEVDQYLFEFEVDPFNLVKDATHQINKYVGEAKKRDVKLRPASYSDWNDTRKIFVLLIDIPELKNSISIFYD